MKKVLVVDDEKLVRQGIISTFPWDKYGFAVTGEAGSGEKALEYLEENKVDLIVTDLAMNGMSGLELIKQVREREGDLPVVVLTCHDSFKTIQEAMRLGVLDYIVKTEIEDEIVEETLRRISEKLNGIGGAGKRQAEKAKGRELVQPSGGALPSEELAGRWNTPSWIYEDDELERLLAETKRSAAGHTEMKATFYQVVLEWDRLLGIGTLQSFLTQFDEIAGWADWEAWIRRFRESVLKKINDNASKPIADIIMRAIELLKNDPDPNINEAAIAKQVNMSRGYFSKCFKRVTGKSYGEYAKWLKLERARLMILQTDLPIMQVAERCGFSDYRHFSRVFRDCFGMLPNEYRKTGNAPQQAHEV
ncbi:response regulator transcription factor [Paenibacillus thermotolerans]|uniref:response regulator transcription factor n=1 Tax=Paenibacillus thermotolerans TaxID=3027807 RepID=UPI002368AEC6|nr:MULTISPECIES: response regulator [unclassified Paenibacillus]